MGKQIIRGIRKKVNNTGNLDVDFTEEIPFSANAKAIFLTDPYQNKEVSIFEKLKQLQDKNTQLQQDTKSSFAAVQPATNDTSFIPQPVTAAITAINQIGTSDQYAKANHIHTIAVSKGAQPGYINIAGANVQVGGWTTFTASTGSTLGVSGLVPAPTTDTNTSSYFLSATGNWIIPPDTNTTYPTLTSNSYTSTSITGLLVPRATVNQQNFYLQGNGSWTKPVGTIYTAANGIRLDGTTFKTSVSRFNNNNTTAASPKEQALKLEKNSFILNQYGPNCEDLPSSAWYYILTTKGSTTGSLVQLALGQSVDAVYYRKRSSNTWGGWKSLVNQFSPVVKAPTTNTNGDVINGRAGLVPALSTSSYENREYYVLKAGGSWGIPNEFVKATSAKDGIRGAVPAPKAAHYDTRTSRFLRMDGVWQVPKPDVFTKAANGDAGSEGLVPAPGKTVTSAQYLNGAGEWTVPPGTPTKYDVVSKNNNGLVPKTGKVDANADYFLNANRQWSKPIGTRYDDMQGASSAAAGSAGLVPAPTSKDYTNFLRGDGQWAKPVNTWQANTSTQNGFVTKGAGNPDSFWTTDANGVPGWRLVTSIAKKFSAPTSAANGTAGLVPAPSSTYYNDRAVMFLAMNGDWRYIQNASKTQRGIATLQVFGGTGNPSLNRNDDNYCPPGAIYCKYV